MCPSAGTKLRHGTNFGLMSKIEGLNSVNDEDIVIKTAKSETNEEENKDSTPSMS